MGYPLGISGNTMNSTFSTKKQFTSQQIIDFWFVETDKAQWWKKDDNFDALIQSKFSDIHRKAAQCDLFSWRNSGPGMLAEIIILDQFSRNMYRDEPESFACDAIALSLAQSAIAGGKHFELDKEKRAFMYMPFMHSESLLIHEEAVKFFTELGVESTLNFEYKHKAIIERFGRYPHRNAILGRVSTPEEEEFLTQPGSIF